MVKIFLNQIQSAAGLTLFTTNNAGDPEYFAANTASRVVAVNSAGNAFELKSYANWDTAFSWGNHAAAGYLTAATATATYVPYTGASGNVNLGEYGIAGGFFSFDTTPTTYTAAVGRLAWNDTDGSLELTLKGGNVIHRVGETSFVRVYNNTGSSISRGSVVYISGSSGQRLTVALADADTEATSKNTLGFAAETIGINSEGFVIISGTISSINTNGFADGDTVFLSSTAGAYTKTAPTQPSHIVILGFVVKGGSTGGGSIFVKVNNGYEIDELHNVLISSIQPNDILYYDSGTQLWKNASIASKIANNSITTSMMSQIATSSFLGRVTAGTGNVEVLTSAQATSILDLFSTTSTTKGLVPGSNNLGNTYFLRADGTWAVPAGGGSGTVTSVDLSMPTGFTVSNNPVTTSGTLTVSFASGYSLPTNTSQSNWDTAYSWGNHASAGYYVGTSTTIRGLFSSTATGLTYTNTTGVFSLTSGYVIPTTTEQSNWNTAYGWGNHASAGYLTSIANNSITDAMLRTSAALSVIGRSANTSGNVADITANNNYEILRRSGTTLGFGSIDLSQSGAVGSSRLAYANLAQGVALSVLGVAGNLANDVASINAASDFHVLRRSGTTLGFGTLNAAAMNATYSAGQYLTTDASGNLSWGTPSGGGGSGTVVTVLSPSSISSWQNNYNPSSWSSSIGVLRIAQSSFNFLTGLTSTTDGHIVSINNISSYPLGLVNKSSDSSSANQFDFDGQDVIVLPGNSLRLYYDNTSTKWKLAESYTFPTDKRWTVNIWNEGLNAGGGSAGTPTDSSSITGNTYQLSGGAFSNPAITGVSHARFGVVEFSTSTSASGIAMWSTAGNQGSVEAMIYDDGTGKNYVELRAVFRMPADLSTSLERYEILMGFTNTRFIAPTRGVWLKYIDSDNSGQWTLNTNGGSTTTVNSTIAPVANTWYEARVALYPNGSAEAFIDGVSLGKSTTNMPTSTHGLYPIFRIMKSVGTTARIAQLDSIQVNMTRYRK